MLVGIDVGTTATKVSVADLDGGVRAVSSAECQVQSPGPGFAECDPLQWWSNLAKLIPTALRDAGIAAADVSAVGVAGMVPTLLCIDRHGKVLGPSIQQNDARATLELAEMSAQTDLSQFLEVSGNPLTIQSIGPTIRWLEQHDPARLRETSRICGSYDWVVQQLTGKATNEVNWAIESGLFDYRSDEWDGSLLDLAHVDENWLTPARRSHEIVGTVTRAASEATGLAVGTPVSAGAADHVASAFSAGVSRPGDLLIKLGGAGDILACTSDPLVDSRLYLDRHLDPRSWLPNGCMATSGAVLEWFRHQFSRGESFADLDRAATQISPGSDGLICQPHFLGEKSPIHDPDSRGMFVGLHLGHTRSHLYRSILEGIACGFAAHIEVLEERGVAISEVRVTNGGSRSRLWRQIVADTIQRPLTSLVDHPGSGLGSAFAAGVGVGRLDWPDIDGWATPHETIEPDPRTGTRLQELAALHQELYRVSAPISHRLAERARTGG